MHRSLFSGGHVMGLLGDSLDHNVICVMNMLFH